MRNLLGTPCSEQEVIKCIRQHSVKEIRLKYILVILWGRNFCFRNYRSIKKILRNFSLKHVVSKMFERPFPNHVEAKIVPLASFLDMRSQFFKNFLQGETPELR